MDEYSLFYVLQVHEIIIILTFDFFTDWIGSLENISWNCTGTKIWMQLQKVYGLTVQKVIYANTEVKSGDKWGQFSMLFDKVIVIL